VARALAARALAARALAAVRAMVGQLLSRG